MKQILLFFATGLLSFFSSAQTFSWVRGLSGPGQDLGNSVVTDAAGNVYSTGLFSDTLDADPGPGTYTLVSNGDFDIYISKLDASGNFIWATSIGGSQYDLGCDVEVDAMGNVLLSGVYTGTVDFDPGPATYTMGGLQQNGFLMKLDASGNFVWAKNFASNDNDGVYSVALDATGNIHLTGTFGAILDFDPGPGTYTLSPLSWDVFVCKLDNAGNFVWARKLGGNSLDQPYSIAVDASGNIYTTGYFRGIADFDPGPGVYNLTTLNSLGLGNAFVSKLDASGNFVWAVGYVGSGQAQTNGLGIAPGGDIVVSGWFKGSIDFDPGITNSITVAQAVDCFITRLSPSGIPVWTNFITGPGDQYIESLAVNASGGIYTVGDFESTVDFDPGPGVSNLTANGAFDVFLQQLDGMGNLVSIYGAGGMGTDLGIALAIDASGNSYITGSYENTVSFNTAASLSSAGSSDAYVLKFDGCLSLVTIQPINVSVLPGATVQFGIVSPGTGFQWQQNIGFGFTNISNGGQFSGAATPTLTITGVGLIQNANIFRCLVTDNTCSLSSSPALLTVGDNTGFHELSGPRLVAAYPNPVTDLVQVRVNAFVPGAVYIITDQLGRQLQSGTLTDPVTTIDMSVLPNGLYFLQTVRSGANSLKLVKQ